MNDEQENRLSMYKALLAFRAEPGWSPTVGAVPAFATAFDNLADIVENIDTASGAQGAAKTTIPGATTDKKGRRSAVVAAVVPVAGALKSLGTATSDNELVALANVSPSRLQRMRDDLLGPTAQNIHAKGVTHAAALVQRGITAAKLTTLQSAITAWTGGTQKPKTKKGHVTAQTTSLAGLFDQSQALVKGELDPLAEGFRFANPAFYAAYRLARSIHDTGNPDDDEPPPTP